MQAADEQLMEIGRRAAEDTLEHFYDPVKAHEYYVRRRQLKGRRPAGSKQPAASRRSSKGAPATGMRPSRRKKLEAQKAALEHRLEVLKRSLDLLVEQAKKRSGVKTPDKKDVSKASKEKKGTPDKKLTAKQKADKRKASKEQYEKENKTTLAGSVQDLQDQVKDMRAKLQEAIEEARRTSAQSKPKTASKGR
jgi:uncharacterized protein (DUF342 family)